ncbi:MAG TPA: preprotein translocase subunit SecG [Gemmatimonadales bacterium]|nr:preprotein translocase subunit SecG [Gemmatimonadales bacterium]
MFYLLLAVLILDALVLSAVVLLQSGQGGGLASLGGGTTETVLGGRQAVTILTKATWWCGGIFLGLSLLLSFVHRGPGGSALQERLRTAAPVAPAPLPGTSGPAAPSPAGEQRPAPGAAAPAREPAPGAPKAAAPAERGTSNAPKPAAPAQPQPKQ